jgi:hypothetical protein
MAEPLESLPDRRRKAKYPWSEWTDGQPWRIRRGEDFKVPLGSMARAIYLHAQKNELRVRVVEERGDSLAFQFSSDSEREAA